ncbi:MAG: hypothetical protein ACLRPV_11540 [Lacrimispora saccharolytica]
MTGRRSRWEAVAERSLFSYAPGTGKTRTMLTCKPGKKFQKRGVDAVVGYSGEIL